MVKIDITGVGLLYRTMLLLPFQVIAKETFSYKTVELRKGFDLLTNTESHLCKLLIQLLPLAVCLMWEGSEMKEGNGSSASTMSQPLYLSLPAPRTIWYFEKTPVKTGYENP